MFFFSFAAALLVARVAVQGSPTQKAATTTTSSHFFQPTAGSTWNIMLSDLPTVEDANLTQYSVWDYDMLDAPASLVQAFKAKGHKVICYFSAGTWEKWRADANQFPAAALGHTVGGWPNEKWLNTSNPEVRDIMVARMKVGQAKGCDGVDPDNIDGYENNTGFDITEDEAVDYVQFLQRTANSLGMACGLKNGGDIIPRVINGSAWSVNEQCVQYNECEPYQAFIKQNKPVFHLEYTKKSPAPKSFVKKSCDDPQAKGFSTLIKHLNLDQWTTTCNGKSTG